MRFGQLLRSAMRAVRVQQFGGPEVLKVENVPIPTPGENQVLIKVQATGVNPVDTYIRSGTYARKPELPYTPGSDAAGVVEAVGPNVTCFKKGDKAYTTRTVTGAAAEYAVSDVTYTGNLFGSLSFSQGAALGVPYYTAYRALITKAQIRPGETILIHGASGAVGIASVQIACAMGLHVIGTAGTAEGMKAVTDNGACQVFNHREEGYAAKIMEATKGEGPSVIIEMLSNINLQKDLEMAKFRGRIVIIGCRGTVEINPRLFMGKELQVMGVMLGSAEPEVFREMTAFLEAGMMAGWLKPLVGKEYPLDQIAQAHNDVINNSGTLGKLVVTMK